MDGIAGVVDVTPTPRQNSRKGLLDIPACVGTKNFPASGGTGQSQRQLAQVKIPA